MWTDPVEPEHVAPPTEHDEGVEELLEGSADGPDDVTTGVSPFAEMGLAEAIVAGVVAAGYKTPTPIQAAAIPVVLTGKDLIAQARTGTGKTAAFGLPALSRLKFNRSPEILVLTPTRELAGQVSDELYKLGRMARIRSVAVYGGQSSRRQIELVERGCQVVVATPGRLLDHLESGAFGDFAPTTVILDEADEMLDMGFLEDIQKIFDHLPPRDEYPRQVLLFSATMPPPIRKLADRILEEPETINLVQQEATNTDVEQSFYVIDEHERLDAVVRIIDAEEPGKAILFCRTKREADELCDVLISRGLQARALHGDIEQGMRQDIIRAFKEGKLEMLVATDVAARGLDVTGVTHVFNYHMPFDQAGYVHRIGRTGRAGQKGKAITLVNPHEYRGLRRLQHSLKASFIHREIPSGAEIKKKENKKFIQKLGLQVVSDEAIDLLSDLEEELDLTQIACKLLTMALQRRKVRGPETIGVKGPRLKSILSGGGKPAGDGGAPRKPFYRGKGGPGGGYRPGGGFKGGGFKKGGKGFGKGKG